MKCNKIDKSLTVIGRIKMGQQHNKVVKRRLRKAYLERCKARVRELIAKKK